MLRAAWADSKSFANPGYTIPIFGAQPWGIEETLGS